ncbi:MAG: OsmC family protein [Gaiellaceae bacterium]
MNDGSLFQFEAETYSSGKPGRALQRVRTNNYVIDDAAFEPYNGPGEAPNASEYFVSGITGCAVLMMERVSRTEGFPVEGVHVKMKVTLDPEAERESHTVFDKAHMHFSFAGVSDQQAARLVDIFKAT